jgi:hypothetical protein
MGHPLPFIYRIIVKPLGRFEYYVTVFDITLVRNSLFTVDTQVLLKDHLIVCLNIH